MKKQYIPLCFAMLFLLGCGGGKTGEKTGEPWDLNPIRKTGDKTIAEEYGDKVVIIVLVLGGFVVVNAIYKRIEKWGNSRKDKDQQSEAERERKNQEYARRAAREKQSTDAPKESELVKYGKILGLAGKMTPRDIKKKYRELIAQYHPDKVSKLGPKLREVSEAESKKINEAYDYFRKKHDF